MIAQLEGEPKLRSCVVLVSGQKHRLSTPQGNTDWSPWAEEERKEQTNEAEEFGRKEHESCDC